MHSKFCVFRLLASCGLLFATVCRATVSFEAPDVLYDCSEPIPNYTIAADLNGDGLEDLLIRGRDGSVSYLPHPGEEVQQPVVILSDTQTTAGELRVMHSYQTHEDFYLAETSDGGVALRFDENFGVTQESFPIDYLPEYPGEIHVCHYFPDAIYSNIVTRGSDEVIRVWSYDGSSWQAHEIGVWPRDYNYDPIFVGDLDGDGLDELVLNESTDTFDQLLYMVPAASTSLNTQYLMDFPDFTHGEIFNFVADDLDQDGDTDLLYESDDPMAGTMVVGWLEQTSPMAFHPQELSNWGGRYSRGLLIADLNHDGRKDILRGGVSDFLFYDTYLNGWLQNETGTFASGILLSNELDVFHPLVAEWNDDSTSCQLLNHGFPQLNVYNLTASGIEADCAIGRSLGGRPAEAVEFLAPDDRLLMVTTTDSNGYNLIPASPLDRHVMVHAGCGGSPFPEVRFTHFNADDFIDPYIFDEIWILPLPLDGHIMGVLGVPSDAVDAFIMDYDANRFLDLIALDSQNNLICVDSLGWNERLLFSLGDLPEPALSCGDASGDGRDDILLRDGNGILRIFENLLDGSFADPVLLEGISSDTKLLLVDLNGDQRNDLLYLNEGLLCHRLWTPDGWGDAHSYFDNEVLQSFAAADIGDGDELEVFGLRSDDAGAELLVLNPRTGQQLSRVLSRGHSLALAHVDEDEDLDLLVLHEDGVDWLENTTTLGIDDASQPVTHHLLECYPNPFNPTTTIPFVIQQPAHLRLSIYNLRGQEVAVLATGEFPAGEHRVTFDGAALASGVYLIRLSGEGVEETRKVLLLK